MVAKTKHTVRNFPPFLQTPSMLLVVSPYYRNITNHLLEGARAVLKGVNAKVELVHVPGALEIPTAMNVAAKHFSGFVALGCVIRGETSHYETVSTESSKSISYLGLQGLCIGNGILTVENYEQAVERADPYGQDKGGGAAEAALCLLALKEKFSKV